MGSPSSKRPIPSVLADPCTPPKLYQLQAIEVLERFLKRTRELGGPATAFAEITAGQGTALPYHTVPGFEPAVAREMPYVCLRLPTGGGKTLLACLSIPVLRRELLQQDHGVVLWLVPSKTILEQTLQALRDRDHPYRQALDSVLGEITVLDLSEALSVQKGTLDSSTVIIVSTLAASRVTEIENRKIYETSGTLHHHFAHLPTEALSHLETDGAGNHAFSLCNVLRLRRPVVIMDEAHNARTQLSFDTLARFRPACILELSATPARREAPSNILVHVSARELAAESMVKLPVRLETRRDWKGLLNDALTMREGLQRDAEAEFKATGEYIRPLLLIKAERQDKRRETITVEVIEKTLIEECHVPAAWVVRATGEDRGLDGVNLNAEDCPIRVIITVDALKEGWDCPWAYILCSVAEMRSDTAVEQIIGRVLRLPQARRKQAAALNRAYVFATSRNFAETARALEDALVEGNGFNPLETKDLIVTSPEQQQELRLSSEQKVPEKVIVVGAVPDTQSWSNSTQEKVQVDAGTQTLRVRQALTSEEVEEVAASLPEGVRETFKVEVHIHNQAIEQMLAPPAERGVQVSVPVFCLMRQSTFELLDETHFLERPWSLMEYIGDFTEAPAYVGEPGIEWGEIGISDTGKVQWAHGAALEQELKMISVTENWTEQGLLEWLDRNIPHPDIHVDESGAYIAHLLKEWQNNGEPLGKLIRERYLLRKEIEKRIHACRMKAKAKAYQKVLFDEAIGPIRVGPEALFSFHPDLYPARSICSRSEVFRNHFYRQVGELHGEGEEYDCALFLDRMPEVVAWVRNLERQPNRSFWLPTATDRFYPDFVCKLRDGRILVVEYKGEHLYSNDDSKEKRLLGLLWQKRSEGRVVFVMPKGKAFEEIRKAIGEVAIREHDCVRLLEPVPHQNSLLPVGTEGVVVSLYEGGQSMAVELEQSESELRVIILKATQLEVVL